MNLKKAALLAASFVVSSPFPLALAAENITVYGKNYEAQALSPAADAEEAQETPGASAIISNTDWQGQRAATIKDMADFLPGVYDEPRNGAESDRLTMRGSSLANIFQGEGILVMQDDVPVNMADGEFEFPVIDPWLINHAVVKPGANALEEGSSMLGGAINFVTATAVTDPGTTLRAEGGSFSTVHGLASEGVKKNNTDLYAAVDGFSQEGFRGQNQQQNTRVDVNGGWQQTRNLDQRIIMDHTTSNAEIPGTITKAQVFGDPTAANPFNIAGNYQRNLDITRLAHLATWQQGGNKLESTAYYVYRMLDNPVTTYIHENNNDMGLRLKLEHTLGLDKWIVGGNLAYGTQEESRFQNTGGQTGAHILSRNLNATTSEAYTQYEHHIEGKLYGIASLHGAYDTRNIWQAFPTVGQQLESYTSFNPRAGLRYDLAPETQLYTNLSRSFQPPSWSELSGGNAPGFKNLSAQTATTFEIGSRTAYKEMHGSVSMYQSWLRNEFINYEFSNGDTATINAGRTVHQGIELNIEGTFARNTFRKGDSLSLRFNGLLNHFWLEDDPLFGDKKLPGMPPYYMHAEALYHPKPMFSLGSNVEWVPKSFPVDLANTLYTSPYAVFGATAAYAPSPKSSFYIQGRNLLNRNYIATTNVIPNAQGLDGRDFYPGEGRGFYAGFKYAF